MKINIHTGNLGPDSVWRYCLTSIWNPIVEKRQLQDHLISTMGIPILVIWHLYIESAPCLFQLNQWDIQGIHCLFLTKLQNFSPNFFITPQPLSQKGFSHCLHLGILTAFLTHNYTDLGWPRDLKCPNMLLSWMVVIWQIWRKYWNFLLRVLWRGLTCLEPLRFWAYSIRIIFI